MAAPILSLTEWVRPDPLNLTDLTGGVGSVVGANGSDYVIYRGGGGSNAQDQIKLLGNQQIAAVPWALTGEPPTFTESSGFPVYFDPADSGARNGYGPYVGPGSSAGRRWYSVDGDQKINAGFRYTFSADERLRHFIWFGSSQIQDVEWTITAALEDGSIAAPEALVFTSNRSGGQINIDLAFRTVEPTTVTIQFSRTRPGNIYTGFGIEEGGCLLTPWVKPARPRGYRKLLRQQGALGGAA